MGKVGQIERKTQERVIRLFSDHLGYEYLGNWEYREGNRNIEKMLSSWLEGQGHNSTVINKTLRELDRAAALGGGKNLYDANKAVYSLLRYGVKVKEGAGEQFQTVFLVDWKDPENNHFGLAEEVTITGELKKRPDLVLYVNGIALGVIELKRASVGVEEGIHQNLDNQKKDFIRNFFTTMQLIMAGNDTQGLRYGTVETPEKYYLQWKEESAVNPFDNPLDYHLSLLCNKQRFLEIIHDFIVFDAGVKKTCRHNQYFGIQAAKQCVKKNQGGIIWHTQGSGKSLTMVWLAKWIREHVKNARVLIITDRTELDDQIEKVFKGVDEDIYRTTSGNDLVSKLNDEQPWLLCSLVHKFGLNDDDDGELDFDGIKSRLPSNFKPKGRLFVFVDECHRTQSGRLHQAMKNILPEAVFIGFTGTPLLKKDKKRSIEVFGGYIHTYKFNEAVSDGVVLDLRYEARDIDQHLTSKKKVDQWFDVKTKGLTDFARSQLKQKWGTMQQVLSSLPRLSQIVNDILLDMDTRPRLMDGRGNAMLVCASIYEACRVYELFSTTELAGKCAIVTSYKPSPADIKGEEAGEGLTEKLKQYEIYRKMLADHFEESADSAMNKVEEFEREVKERFLNEPGQMRLLIVVDKLLTGFDAPSATYLYIDKKMRDHGLFQAICRVNRLDGDDKDYGYIIDYKDLFHHLEGAIDDYTSGALDGYEANDVAGLLSDRLEKGHERLEEALEKVKALCEPVMRPRETQDYLHYFCAEDTSDKEALARNEPKRLALYKEVAALMRAYANLANEMEGAGYSAEEIEQIRQDVTHFGKARDEVKVASGDYIDMKRYEPAMRRLLDSYIRADESEVVSALEDLGLVDLIVNKGDDAFNDLPEGIKKSEEAMAETIENNIRKVIIDEQAVNPKHYGEMSELLDALIEQRKTQAVDYQEYLEKIKELAWRIKQSGGSGDGEYPATMDTVAMKSLYDNLDNDEALVLQVDTAVRITKKDGWTGNRMKEKEVRIALMKAIGDNDVNIDDLLELVKNQHEYQ
jgi:type I restriction enzyme R subunit